MFYLLSHLASSASWRLALSLPLPRFSPRTSLLLFLLLAESACGDKPNSAASTTSAASVAPRPLPPPPPPPRRLPAESDPKVLAVRDGLLPSITLNGVDLRMKLADRMARFDVPALALAVIENGKLAWARSWGVRALGKPEAVDVETAFQAASISKPVTALAVLRLVEERKLDLEADVASYLKSWQVPAASDGKPTTLRRLLSHTSGLSAPEQFTYFDLDGSMKRAYEPGAALPTTLQVLTGAPPALNAKVVALDGMAGRYSYSGGGYTVLQLVVEEVTGEPFEKALARLVLEPLGMKHSTFAAAPPSANAAHAHDAAGKVPPGGWVALPEKAAGGLWTTASDLALLVADLMAAANGEPGRLLKPESAKRMLTPVVSSMPSHGGSMGLGMFVSDDPGELWFSHNGHNPGFHSSFAAMPASGKGVVVLMNRESGAELVGEILNAVGVAYDWPARSGMRPREREVASVAPEVLARYAGSFAESGASGAVELALRVSGSELYAALDGAPELRVYPVADTVLFEPTTPFQLKFEGDGSAVACSTPGAGERVAKRRR